MMEAWESETNIMQAIDALGMRVFTDGALASTATAPLRSSATVLTTTVCSTPRWIWVMLKLYALWKKEGKKLFENYQQLFDENFSQFYQGSGQSQSHVMYVCNVPLYFLTSEVKHCRSVMKLCPFKVCSHYKYLCLICHRPERLAV